jgi:hypothetical protein
VFFSYLIIFNNNFKQKKKITGVIVQGRSGKQEWVTSFMISYSTDAFQWQYITDKYGNQKIFQGNFDDHSLKHNYFDHPVKARFIKFHTIQWFKHPSLRVEIIGCQGFYLIFFIIDELTLEVLTFSTYFRMQKASWNATVR